MSKNNGQVSGLSIIALILSLLGITSLIGVALGLVDLRKKDGRSHIVSTIAIIIGCIFIIFFIFTIFSFFLSTTIFTKILY